jgi:regulator of sigma E protease
MQDIASSIVGFIVAIGVLVAVHEFGHYWVARRLGFKVLRFSIGFGRPLLRWRGAGPDHVEYWLSAIPLGGYVKMLDEREGPVPTAEAHRSFTQRPVWARILVLLAGPAFNFLFAIAAYWFMFSTGVPGIKPLIGAVVPDSVAARAGIEANDTLLTVGGRSTETWEAATLAIFDELLNDARIELTIRDSGGATKDVALDVRGREAELTEPSALFRGLGIRPGPPVPPVIGDIAPDSPALRAGLAVGDEVRRANGAPIATWEDWVDFVRSRPGEEVSVDLRRDGEPLSVALAIGSIDEEGKTIGRIGASAVRELPASVIEDLQAEQRYGVLESLPKGIAKTWEMTSLTVKMIGHMIVGQVSLKNMSGPLTIATVAGESAQQGFSSFFNFLAVVSISLGIINLVPIPLLDGGQVVYQIVEWVKGSPLSERALAFGQQVGVAFLIVLMSFVFYNDLTRIFGS